VIVDVHGHITHPELFKRYPMPQALLDIDGMLDRKSDVGIDLTVVGSPVGFGTMTPVPDFDAFTQPLDELEMFHEWLAETVRKHAPRLAAYAFTNPFGGDEMLARTARTVVDGGFVGLIVNTSIHGEYLDSERADDFFAMAAELDVPILLHPPAEPVGSSSFSDFRLVEQVGRFLDVTASLAALVFGGRLEQHPGLKVIGATAGGAVGLLAGRLDSAYRPRHWASDGPPGEGPPGGGPPGGGPPGGGPPGGPQLENKITEPPTTYLRQIYVDTANSSLPNHLANLDVVGADHLLFGTDSPPLSTPLQTAIDAVGQLPVSDEDKEKILHGNAERLFDFSRAGIQTSA
jgi:aminocarboxymuconate-semialdehyde decarboxylase